MVNARNDWQIDGLRKARIAKSRLSGRPFALMRV